jgi:hypothetical protein
VSELEVHVDVGATSRRLVILVAALLGLAAGLGAEVGVTDGRKGVVVNTRNGKAYAAFPDLGIVKIVHGAAGPVVTLKTGANVKNLTLDPRSGRVYAMNRGPGTISVIDPDSDAIVDTLKADRGSLTALNPVTNKLYVSASTGTDPSVIEDNFLTVVDGVTHEPSRDHRHADGRGLDGGDRQRADGGGRQRRHEPHLRRELRQQRRHDHRRRVEPADRDGQGRAVAAANRDQRQDEQELCRQHARQQRVRDRRPHEYGRAAMIGGGSADQGVAGLLRQRRVG